MNEAVQKRCVQPKNILSPHQEVDELIQEELEGALRGKKIVDNEHAKLEQNENDLNSCLEILVENTRLSKFQIIDQMVEKISTILEERGITEFDVSQIDSSIEEWTPYVTVKLKSPPEFIRDVYGEYRGITRADIRKIDHQLCAAYDNWVSDKKPLPKNFSLSDKSETGLENPSPYQRYTYQRVNSGIAQKIRKSN